MHGQAGVEERIGFRVALVRVPGTDGCRHRQPALGLAYLCSYLKAGGIECRVFDARFRSWSAFDLVKRVAEYRPHLVGFTALTSEVRDAARIALRLKEETSARAVIGGPHVTALPRRTLKEFKEFDYGINGEGERPLLHLAEWLRDNLRNAKDMVGSIRLDGDGIIVYSRPSTKYIDGIIHRDKDGVTINARPPLLSSADIDALPFPDLDDYYGIAPDALKARGAFCVLAATRGTPNRNPFSLPVLGREVRWRSADNVLREMERAVCRWGAHTFCFCDEALIHDSEEARGLLGLLAERPLPGPVKWSAAGRPGLIPEDLVRLAKKAGCFRLRLDVGAGDDDILEATGKGTTVARVAGEIRAIKNAGIEVEAFFTLGNPGETEQQIRKTTNLVAELNPDFACVDLIIPYPGTGIYEMALRGAGGYKRLSEDWSRYAGYGGKIVEIEALPYRKLAAWRRRALVGLYLRNRRPLDLLRYLWMRRSAIGLVMGRKLGVRLVAKERFTG